MVQFYVDLTSPAHTSSARGLNRSNTTGAEPGEVDDVEILDELVLNIPDSQIMYDGILASRQHSTETLLSSRRAGNTGTTAVSTNQEAGTSSSSSSRVTRSMGRPRPGDGEQDGDDDDIICISPPPVEVVEIVSSSQEEEEQQHTRDVPQTRPRPVAAAAAASSSSSHPDRQSRYRRRSVSRPAPRRGRGPPGAYSPNPTGSYYRTNGASSATPASSHSPTTPRVPSDTMSRFDNYSSGCEDREGSDSADSDSDYLPPTRTSAVRRNATRELSASLNRRKLRPAGVELREGAFESNRSTDNNEHSSVPPTRQSQQREAGRKTKNKKNRVQTQTSKRGKETLKRNSRKKQEQRSSMSGHQSDEDEWNPPPREEDELENTSEDGEDYEATRNHRPVGQFNETSDEEANENNTDCNTADSSRQQRKPKSKRGDGSGGAASGSGSRNKVRTSSRKSKKSKNKETSSDSENSETSEELEVDDSGSSNGTGQSHVRRTKRDFLGHSSSSKSVKSSQQQGAAGPSGGQGLSNSKSSSSSGLRKNKFEDQIGPPGGSSSSRDGNSESFSFDRDRNENRVRRSVESGSSRQAGLTERDLRRPSVILVSDDSFHGAASEGNVPGTNRSRSRNKTAENSTNQREDPTRSCLGKTKVKSERRKKKDGHAQKINGRRMESENNDSSDDESEEFNAERNRDNRDEQYEISEPSDVDDLQQDDRGEPERQCRNQTIVMDSDSDMSDHSGLDETERNDDEMNGQSGRNRDSKTSNGNGVRQTKSKNNESNDISGAPSRTRVSGEKHHSGKLKGSRKIKANRKNSNRSSENHSEDKRNNRNSETGSGTTTKRLYLKGQVKFKPLNVETFRVASGPLRRPIRMRYTEQSSSAESDDDERNQEEMDDDDFDAVRTHDDDSDTDGSNGGNDGGQGSNIAGKGCGKENDGSRKNENEKNHTGNGESRQYKTKGHDGTGRVCDEEHGQDSQEDENCAQQKEEEIEGNTKTGKETEDLEIENSDDEYGLPRVNNKDKADEILVPTAKTDEDVGSSEQVKLEESLNGASNEGSVKVCKDSDEKLVDGVRENASHKNRTGSEDNQTGQSGRKSTDKERREDVSSEKSRQENLGNREEQDNESEQKTVKDVDINGSKATKDNDEVSKPKCESSEIVFDMLKPENGTSMLTKSFRDDNQQPTCSKYLNNDSHPSSRQCTRLPGIETLVRFRSENNTSQSSSSSVDDCQGNENGEYLRLSQLDAVSSQEPQHFSSSTMSATNGSTSQGAYVTRSEPVNTREEIIQVEVSDDDRSQSAKPLSGYTNRNVVTNVGTDDDDVITVDDVRECKRPKEVVLLSSDDDGDVWPLSLLSTRQINYQHKKFNNSQDKEVEVIVEDRPQTKHVVVHDVESDDELNVVDEISHAVVGPSESRISQETNHWERQAHTIDTDDEIVEVDSSTLPFDILSTIENLATNIHATVGEIREQDRQHEERSREKILRKQYRRQLRDDLRRDIEEANRQEKEGTRCRFDDFERVNIDPTDAIFGPSQAQERNDEEHLSTSHDIQEGLSNEIHTNASIQKPEQFPKSRKEYFTNKRLTTNSAGSSVLSVEFESMDNTDKQGKVNNSIDGKSSLTDVTVTHNDQEIINVESLDENSQTAADASVLCIQNDTSSVVNPTILGNQNDSTTPRNPKEHVNNQTEKNAKEILAVDVKCNESAKRDDKEVIHVQDDDDDCDSDDVQPIIPVTSDIDVVNNSSTENSLDAITEIVQPQKTGNENGDLKNYTSAANSARSAKSSKNYIRKILKWNQFWNGHKQRTSTESDTDRNTANAKRYESTTVSKGNFSGSSSDLMVSSSYGYVPDSNNATVVSDYATTCEGPSWSGDNQSTLSSGSPVNYTIYENHTKQVATRVLCDANRMDGSNKRCASSSGGRIMEITTQETYDVVKIEHKKNRRKHDRTALGGAERLAVQSQVGEPNSHVSNVSLLGRNSHALLGNPHRSELTSGRQQSQTLARNPLMLPENDQDVRVQSSRIRKHARTENSSPPLAGTSKRSHHQGTESCLEPYPTLGTATSVGADADHPSSVYGSYYTPMHSAYLTFYNNRFNETDSPRSSRHCSDEEERGSRRSQHKAYSENKSRRLLKDEMCAETVSSSVKQEPNEEESDDVNVDAYDDDAGETKQKRCHDNPPPDSTSADSEQDSSSSSDSSSGYKSTKREHRSKRDHRRHHRDGSKQRKRKHKRKSENSERKRKTERSERHQRSKSEEKNNETKRRDDNHASSKNEKSETKYKGDKTKTNETIKTDLLDHYTGRIKTEHFSDHEASSRKENSDYHINSRRENSDYHVTNNRKHDNSDLNSCRNSNSKIDSSRNSTKKLHNSSRLENNEHDSTKSQRNNVVNRPPRHSSNESSKHRRNHGNNQSESESVSSSRSPSLSSSHSKFSPRSLSISSSQSKHSSSTKSSSSREKLAKKGDVKRSKKSKSKKSRTSSRRSVSSSSSKTKHKSKKKKRDFSPCLSISSSQSKYSCSGKSILSSEKSKEESKIKTIETKLKPSVSKIKSMESKIKSNEYKQTSCATKSEPLECKKTSHRKKSLKSGRRRRRHNRNSECSSSDAESDSHTHCETCSSSEDDGKSDSFREFSNDEGVAIGDESGRKRRHKIENKRKHKQSKI
uniref:Uncharacterized protein n=1 Tax=Cacopsylla melanoneura TaxID=428564 RepID=A0A8D8SCU3_9HEMI